jgi:ribose 5-phosphate isomerase B
MAEQRVIAVGADHAGVGLKDEVVKILRERGEEILDLGTVGDASVDYPDFAHAVSRAILEGRAQLGVLVCGTGVGMSMAANRHQGIRAVVCSETFSARMAREHNDANILCFGARVVGVGVARDLLEAFLSTSHAGGRHTHRVEKIDPR